MVPSLQHAWPAAMIQIDFSQTRSKKKNDLSIDRRSSRRAGRFGSVSIVSLHKLSSHGAHGGLAGGCIYLFQFLLRCAVVEVHRSPRQSAEEARWVQTGVVAKLVDISTNRCGGKWDARLAELVSPRQTGSMHIHYRAVLYHQQHHRPTFIM